MVLSYIEIIERAAEDNFEAIRDSEDLMGDPEYDLAIVKWFCVIEKFYLNALATNIFEKEKILDILEKFGFDKEHSAKHIDFIEKGLFDNDFNEKLTIEVFQKDKSDSIFILQAKFNKMMLAKGFHFAVSGRIWELMMQYWNENNKNSKNYFAIDHIKFDEHLTRLSGSIFTENSMEMYALLWGSVYIYDFLLENELIEANAYNDFYDSTRKLKGILIANKSSHLWEFNFIHKWQRPNSISDNEFVEESKIFEKSINYCFHSEINFLDLIEPELANIGEFSEYIINGKIKKEDRTSLLDSFFSNNFQKNDKQKTFINPIENTIGRNDPCHCGSGKKYKKCCMK